MKSHLALRLLPVALGALLLTGCKGPEGVYKLDKTETKKTLEAEIAKAPAEQQAMGKLVLAMFDQMDMSLELVKGGEASMKMSMASGPGSTEPKTETKAGTWTKDGNAIVIDSGGKKMSCTLEGTTLSCDSTDKGGNKLVFIRS